VTWNEGVTKPISLVAPEGTVVNCVRPAPISIATVGTIQIVNNLSTIVLGKMFGASPRYADRATAVWHGSHAHLETHGLDAEGQFFVAPLTDTFCGAGGARALRDGVDLGGEIPNVVSRWANVESQELGTPLRYLYRRAVPDSGGPGKHRGGVCHEYAFTPSGGRGAMGLVLFGKGTRAPMSLGLFGGYPGCNVGYSTFRSANVDELPGSLDETRGASREDVFWGHVELEEGDVQYVRFMGGGGYGDPIDRDPALVERDVASGLVSPDAAREIYGVVPGDAEATDARRLEIRRERLRGSDPRPSADIDPTGRRISEWLQRSADGSTQCTRCGTAVAPVEADWKEHAALRRLPIERAGPLRAPVGEFFLLESSCPGCAALLDADVVLGDDPPLHDRIEEWPG
jgi:N-methylhydantoinase B